MNYVNTIELSMELGNYQRKKYGTMTYATLSDSLYGKFERQPYEFRRALVTHVRENMQYRTTESQEAGDSYFDDAYERFGLLLLEQGYPSEAIKAGRASSGSKK